MIDRKIGNQMCLIMLWFYAEVSNRGFIYGWSLTHWLLLRLCRFFDVGWLQNKIVFTRFIEYLFTTYYSCSHKNMGKGRTYCCIIWHERRPATFSKRWCIMSGGSSAAMPYSPDLSFIRGDFSQKYFCTMYFFLERAICFFCTAKYQKFYIAIFSFDVGLTLV